MKAWLLVMFASFQVSAMSLDETLRVAIQAFELEGNVCSKPLVKEPSYLADVGKVVFERPVLSGDKDTACANCHLDNKALTDGLPLAIGVGGDR